MDEPKIGDQVFIYGHLIQDFIDDDVTYNSLMGYMTTGGFITQLERIDHPTAAVPGFLVDFRPEACLTLETPFVKVTEQLALQAPRLAGSEVWLAAPSQM